MTRNGVDTAIPAPPPTTRWRHRLLLLAVFASGCVAGAVGGGVWTRHHMIEMLRHPLHVSERVLPRLRSRFALDEEQSRKVTEIVRRRHARMESLRADAYPKLMFEFHALRDEVSAILAPDQVSVWTAFCDSIEQKYLPPPPVAPAS